MDESTQEIVPIAMERMPAEMSQYFLCFSLFEKCLKERGAKYLNIYEDGKFRVKHYDFFSEALRNDRKLSAEIMRTSPSIRVKAPRKQIIVDGKVEFEKPHRGKMNANLVLEALPCIRNNLFHGGKWPSGPEDETARDLDLLREAMAILLLVLNSCLSSDDPDLQGVGTEFREGLVKLAGA